MEIIFTLEAENDLTFWKRTNNTSVLKRIRLLLENILETPYSGIGKPEALKYELSGKVVQKNYKNRSVDLSSD